MTTEAARQAAREFNDKLGAETGASLNPWILARVTDAIDTFAAAEVEKAVTAERERIIRVVSEFSLSIPDPYDVSAAWALENVVRKIKQPTTKGHGDE